MGAQTASRVKFSDLDPVGKLAVFWLADQAGTFPANVTAAAQHAGEIFEAAAFMREHPKGSAPHVILADRLKLAETRQESILACIQRAVPTYRCVEEREDLKIDELLAELKSMRGC